MHGLLLYWLLWFVLVFGVVVVRSFATELPPLDREVK
jgi:hypothetical protein